jgi:hypothetical protein
LHLAPLQQHWKSLGFNRKGEMKGKIVLVCGAVVSLVVVLSPDFSIRLLLLLLLLLL